MSERRFKVAAAHAAPVFLDTARTVDKACALIEEAARNGARLIAFPESFVPGFPLWNAVQAPIYSHDFFVRLAQGAVRVPGPEIGRIVQVARRHRIFVSLGFTEGTAASVGCLWNSNVLIGEDGALLNHHRKLVPTFYEKLTWAGGDGAGLRVVETAIGRVGALICGENTNPLARYALIAGGEELHVSTYPPTWPTRDPREAGRYDLADAIRIRAAAHSFEAKCFNVVAAGFLDAATRAALAPVGGDGLRIIEETPRGVSLVLDPMGRIIAGPVADEEGLLYAEVDLDACIEPKQFHDVSGGYNRFDVFQLRVDRRRHRPATFDDGDPSAAADALGGEAGGKGSSSDPAPDRPADRAADRAAGPDQGTGGD